MFGLVRSRVHSGVVAAVVLMMAAETAAWADEEPEALIRQGVEMRKHGEDAKAYGYFKRAYDLSHTPRAAAQLGLVEQALASFVDANQHLTEALESHDPWVNQKRSVLEQSRETVRGQLGRIEVHGLPADARVALAGLSATPVPPDRVLWVAPGTVKLTFSAPNHEALEKEAAISAKAHVTLDVQLPPSTATPATAPPPVKAEPEVLQTPPPATPAPESPAEGSEGRGLRIGGIVTAGVGVALGITGAVIYSAGASKVNAIEQDASAVPPRPYNEANANYHERDTGVGLIVAGGAAVATGVILYIVGHNGASTPKDTNVSMSYVPGVGGNIAIVGRF